MGYLSKKRRKAAIAVSISYLVLIGLAIAFIVIRGIGNVYPTYLLNIGIDMFGMFAGYVLFVCCLADVQKTGSDNRYFICLLNVTFFGLFTDLVAWLVNGVPNMWVANIIDNTLYYMCFPLEAFFFWIYVTAALRTKKGLDRNINRVMQVLLLVALIANVVNIFTGMYFTVDRSGVYSRSSLYPLSLIYGGLAAVATVILIIVRRKQIHAGQAIVLLVYIAAPLAASVFSFFFYGLSVSYGLIMLVLLLMYCVLNIDQGRDKVVVDKELNMATQIQESMLPNIFPAFPDRTEFDVYATMDPAKEVGGDFYDYFLIDDDHLCMVMADVSGKGVPAALFMMASKIILANNAMSGKSPARILTDTNASICSNNRMEMFVTVWLGIFEISTGKLTAANAGHEFPILKKADGSYEIFKDKHGFVVGGMDGVQYKEYELYIEPGAKLFLYTDGVPEATDAGGAMFGTERLLAALNADTGAPPDAVLKNVRKAVDAFVGNAEQFDDLTMLCMEYKSKKGVSGNEQK